MIATIYEVAKKSGFSIGTVSRVLNGVPLHSESTCEKVLQVVNELNYRPDAMAQGLARRKNSTNAANPIGVVAPLDNASLEILRGIQRGLAQHNCDLLLHGIEDWQQQDALVQRVLQKRRLNALLLVSTKISEESAQACQNRRLPVMLVESYHEQFDTVTVDNQAGALLAIQYLTRIGYRQFALLTGPRENFSAQLRFQDCRRALRKAGMGLSDNLSIGNHQEQSGYLALKNFLEQRRQNGEARELPLAVFVTSDMQIPGAIKAIQQAGLHIPDDVALIDFENGALAEHAGLMTVRQPFEEIGFRAVERLMARRENPNALPRRLSLQPELVVRKSWGAKRQAFAK